MEIELEEYQRDYLNFKDPEVLVVYRVGSEVFQYKTEMWFLTSYKPGDIVTVIYDPSHPSVASIYSFIGYWIKWPELFFTAAFFIILFVAALSISGKNTMSIHEGGP